jgi:hypothetical protein
MWEYCEIFLFKDEIVTQSNTSGQEGWELVTILRNNPCPEKSQNDLLRCVFKRPIKSIEPTKPIEKTPSYVTIGTIRVEGKEGRFIEAFLN